ncbi:MAG: Minf_1886 family protein [Candidatus Omnitrophota bacterium]
MSKFSELIEGICAADERYSPDAYEFVFKGLTYAQKKLKKQSHITGRELSLGLRDYAVNEYGALARTVLAHWGIGKTEDFGNIVYNMIGKKLMSRSEEDRREDFNAVYDFEPAFANALEETMELKISDKP